MPKLERGYQHLFKGTGGYPGCGRRESDGGCDAQDAEYDHDGHGRGGDTDYGKRVPRFSPETYNTRELSRTVLNVLDQLF